MSILVLNAGSSSIKCALFDGTQKRALWRGEVQWKEGFRDARLESTTLPEAQKIDISSAKEGLSALMKSLSASEKIVAVGHRVVHGGEKFVQTTPISPEVKDEIRKLSRLAPLHNPANLEGIEAMETLFPGVPQFAIFDTAFHATLSDVASTYPGPYSWRERGIRRYGFHGISHEYCSHQAANLLKRPLEEIKLTVCHLGAGASLCAVKGGKSIDTTMGFTPLEGVMMASRSGSVDPGILIHLMREENVSVERLDHLLNKESGLYGISGISEDLRDLEESANPRAQLAIDLFIHRLCASLGEMIISLQGLDALVFTAGIGEHSSLIRMHTCSHLNFLGVKIDPAKNTKGEEGVISSPDSKVDVVIVYTQEEWAIAQKCLDQLP